MTDLMDELKGEVKVEDTLLTENNTSLKDKRKKMWDDFKKSYDWEKLPLHVLVTAILIIGAFLMGLSVYTMTGNLFIAILSPAFTELGLIAAHGASNRPKNSVRQREISRKLRNWHIFTSVTLLMSNLVIETATSLLSIKIDGVVYFIFGIIGLTSLIDIVSYFRYQDNDDELTTKNNHTKKMENIKSATLMSRMQAFEDAEKIKSEELVKFWQENAPELARYKARIEAAKEIKNVYLQLDMTPEEANKLLGEVGFIEGTVINDEEEGNDNNNGSGKRPYKKTGQYSKKNQLTPPQEKPESFPIGETQPQQVVDEEKMNRMKDAKIFS